MDDPMQKTRTGDTLVVKRLETFANVRLSPDPAAVRRMRARVMRDARATLRSPTVTSAPSPAAPGPVARRWIRGRGTRRGAGLLLAATLSLTVLGGAALAAGPGRPLYGAALWFEEAMLPAAGPARNEAQIARLEHRLGDAQAAAQSGDGGAVAAALAAYRETVDDALASVTGDGAWEARLDAALGTHLIVLEALMGQVPEHARAAIEQAINKSHQAHDRIGGRGGPSSPGGPGNPDKGPKKTAEPEPARTPKPDKTPRPAPTLAPAAPPATTPEPTLRPTPRTNPSPPAEPGQPASPGRASP
jgi:hypothetical protein